MRVVTSIDEVHAERRQACAAQLRELADRMEAGAITDVVAVWNDVEELCFASWGDFTDRWRILGALEYAKSHIFRG